MALPDPMKIMDALAGTYGKNDEESTVSIWLDTGYVELNHALSGRWDGGLPVGRIIELSGPPSAGKTALATAAMASAQKAGGIGGFSDHERSFSNVLAQKIGLDTTPGRFLFKKPRTFEESIDMMGMTAALIRKKKLIAPEAPIAWVFDSLASMVPQSALFDKNEKERGAADRNMNDNTALARATSAHFPALAQHVEEFGICCIFLNQIRTKLGVLYGDPRTTPGGDAPKFYASQRIMLGSSKITKGTDTIGAEVTASVIKNKVCRPFTKATWRFMFQPDGTGRFDVERSTIDFLEKNELIEKGRAGYVKWDGKEVHKEELARRVQAGGLMPELHKLLPKVYEPEVLSEVEVEELAAA